MAVNTAMGLPRRTRPSVTLAAVCAAIVFVPVTATGASVVLPNISSNLNTSLPSAQWVVNAFFLTFASFMAISGSLADLTGRRRMFTGGVAIFSAAMLVAALAPDIGVLIAARVLAGVGAAAATTGGSALLAQTFEGQARIKAFGVFGTAIGLGLAFGPLVAGVMVTSLGGWRVFFAVVAVVVLPVIAVSPLLTESRDPHPAGPDVPGAVTFTVGLSLFVLSLVEGPSLGWTNPLVLATLSAFAVLIVVFVMIERHREHPMIDVSLFAEPRFLAICAMPVLLAFGFVALLIELPSYFIAVDGVSAQTAGLILVFLTGPTLVVPVLVSLIAHRVPRRILLVATMVFIAAGAAWLTVIHPNAAIAELAGPMLAIGIGCGISLAILDGAAVSSVEPARAGMAAGVFNTMRLTGESASIAILGALLTAVTQSRLTATLGSAAAARVTGKLLEGDMSGAVAAVPGQADLVRTAGAAAYTDALHIGLWAITVLSVVGAITVGILARDEQPDVPGQSVDVPGQSADAILRDENQPTT